MLKSEMHELEFTNMFLKKVENFGRIWHTLLIIKTFATTSLHSFTSLDLSKTEYGTQVGECKNIKCGTLSSLSSEISNAFYICR